MADEKNPPAISAISIKGFKSFLDEQSIEIRPLTLLAGANSSGKSSSIQPLLLMKQTLDDPFDRGALKLSGPHVRLTSASQALSRLPGQKSVDEFEVAVAIRPGTRFRQVFRKNQEEGFDLVRMDQPLSGAKPLILEPGLSSDEIENRFPQLRTVRGLPGKVKWEVVRNRCFLAVAPAGSDYPLLPFVHNHAQVVSSIIHVPGLRGNPKRTYETSIVGDHFQGEFTESAASVIASWQSSHDDRVGRLEGYLGMLGLTSRIVANRIDATRVELVVGRTSSRKGTDDLVNIADVGIGVSQVVPVLVALLVAKPGQLVFLEEPEFHLHPRAEQVLATILAEAANRGVRVVAETHSSILLLAVQTLVAEGKIAPDKVILHWFQRDARGATKVTSGEMDQLGAYGDWPEDFGEVQAAVDNRYLDAVESRVFSRKKRAKK